MCIVDKKPTKLVLRFCFKKTVVQTKNKVSEAASALQNTFWRLNYLKENFILDAITVIIHTPTHTIQYEQIFLNLMIKARLENVELYWRPIRVGLVCKPVVSQVF